MKKMALSVFLIGLMSGLLIGKPVKWYVTLDNQTGQPLAWQVDYVLGAKKSYGSGPKLRNKLLAPKKLARTEYGADAWVKTISLGLSKNKLVKTYSFEDMGYKGGLNYTQFRLASERDKKPWAHIKNDSAYFKVEEKDGKPYIAVLDKELKEARDKQRRKDFLEAVNSGDVSRLTTLLDQGTSEKNDQMVNEKNKDGKTPLQIAIEKEYAEVARLLLKHGAQINPDAAYVKQVLENELKKAEASAVKMSEILFDACFKAKGAQGVERYGGLFLSSAVLGRNKQYLDKVLNAGVDINLEYTTPTSRYSSLKGTALIYAVTFGATDMVQALLDKKADPNLKNGDGETPLMWATKHKNLKLVKLLLDAKADPNLKNEKGETPLMVAAQMKDGDSLVTMLLKSGADPNLINNRDETALMKAAREGVRQHDIVKELLKAGAQKDLKNKQGQTAQDIAEAGEYGTSVARTIRDYESPEEKQRREQEEQRQERERNEAFERRMREAMQGEIMRQQLERQSAAEKQALKRLEETQEQRIKEEAERIGKMPGVQKLQQRADEQAQKLRELQKQWAAEEEALTSAAPSAPPAEQKTMPEETPAQKSRDEAMQKLYEKLENMKSLSQQITEQPESDPEIFESKAEFMQELVGGMDSASDGHADEDEVGSLVNHLMKLDTLFPSEAAQKVVAHLRAGKYETGYFLEVTKKGGLLHSKPALIYFLKKMVETMLLKMSDVRDVPSNRKMAMEIRDELSKAFKQTTKASRLNPAFSLFSKKAIQIFDSAFRLMAEE